MNITKLKHDLKIIQRALGRDKQGYDEDGYNEEGFDRYGRSRERMEEVAKYTRMAFNSLTPDKQAFVMKAENILQKYVVKAIAWENQPEEVKQQSPFYEHYSIHSPITKHSFLVSVWITKQEDALCTEATRIMLQARRKFDPSYSQGKAH